MKFTPTGPHPPPQASKYHDPLSKTRRKLTCPGLRLIASHCYVSQSNELERGQEAEGGPGLHNIR